MKWPLAFAIVGVALSLALVIVGCSVSTGHHSTERERICVTAGGSYVRGDESTKMECHK